MNNHECGNGNHSRLGRILPVGAASPKYSSTNSRRPSLSLAKRKASSPKQFKALATLASSILYESARSATAAN